MPRVVVYGSINADFIFRVASLPKRGETVEAVREIYPGGKGANQAVAASSCGARVELVGAVGSDSDGTSLMEHLRKRGVGVSSVELVEGETTGAAAIPVDALGQNSVIYAPGANLRVLPTLTQARKHVSRAGAVSTMLEIPLIAVETLAKACQLESVPFILNAAPVKSLGTELLGKVTILIVNEHEAAELASEPVVSVDDAVRVGTILASRGPKAVVVTLGAQGAVAVSSSGDKHHCQSPGDVEVVDTTGAGDTFCGAFSTFIARGDDLASAVDRAVRVASLQVQYPGAQLPADVAVGE